VPKAPLKFPPVPAVLVQTPPDCSAVISENKSMAVVLLSQIDTAPSTPAFGCALMSIVARLLESTHGGVPVIV
jgi:hypothetical protein